jgi:hypothetical protein
MRGRGYANFGELRHSEVRRILLPRTRANKGSGRLTGERNPYPSQGRRRFRCPANRRLLPLALPRRSLSLGFRAAPRPRPRRSAARVCGQAPMRGGTCSLLRPGRVPLSQAGKQASPDPRALVFAQQIEGVQPSCIIDVRGAQCGPSTPRKYSRQRSSKFLYDMSARKPSGTMPR